MNHSIDRFMTPHPRTIDEKATIGEARKLMIDNDVRHLPVVRNNEIVGVLSQRDLLRLETVVNVDQTKAPVSDAMTIPAFVVAPEDDLSKVARKMAKEKIGSAVVARGAKVVGIFTTTDALQALGDLV